jgi:predicted kinase
MQAVLLIGLQGSGKTTLYRERFAGTHVHVSLDEVGTRERERALIENCIARGVPFVVDNTNILRRDRAVYIAIAKQAGYSVAGYYFPPNVWTSIGRNKHRADKKPVAVPAILSAFKRLEAPVLGEGFDELHEM